MDTKQPEALRLAHIFEHPLPPEWSDMVAATKELRRQHTENATLQSGYDAARLEVASLQAEVAKYRESMTAGAYVGCVVWAGDAKVARHLSKTQVSEWRSPVIALQVLTDVCASELARFLAKPGGSAEPLRKTNAAARGTDAQIIKERELCAYAFAGAIADGLSGGAGPDTQNAEWLRPAFEAGKEIAQLRAEIEPLRKRECLHQIAEPAPLNKATAEHALRRILHIVQRYLPPDGMSIDKAMNEIIAVVDPWPVAEGDAGMYPQLPRATMFATVLDGGFAIGNIGVYTPDQMRAYADATCAARAATTTSAPVVLPEPIRDDTYTRRMIEALHENGDPVSVDAAEELERLRALLATATGLPAQAARTWSCPVRTVADLANNLLTMDQTLPIYGAQYIEHPAGRRRAIAVPPTVSIERVKDSRWIGEGDELNAAIIWTQAEQPAAPQAQADARDALEEAASVLSSINKGASHEVQVGDEVCYWQRKEWIEWAEKEVLPKVRAAIDVARAAQGGA